MNPASNARGPTISVIQGFKLFPGNFIASLSKHKYKQQIKSDRRTKENELAWTKTVNDRLPATVTAVPSESSPRNFVGGCASQVNDAEQRASNEKKERKGSFLDR